MLQSASKIFGLLCAIIFTQCYLLISCGFIDLRPINITIEPGKAGAVLPAADSPVIIKFDTEMIKNDAEGILQITSDSGSVSGDKFWKGNNLYFVPVQGWTAGIRYALSLTGSIRSIDGRELRIERYISFYAVNNNHPPVLVYHNPPDGASVSTNNINYEFHFSRSMDRLSTESALILEGISKKNIEWSADDKILKVALENALSPWVLYKWSVRDSAKSADGVPLQKTYSGHFITDMDQTPPKVTGIYPVLNENGRWYATGLEMETGLRQGHGIAVEFNKPMGESVLRSLRFEPSLQGRTEYLSEESIVYIFARDPEPETIYTLTISGDTRDIEGLKIGTDFKIYFTPDIPVLKILSVKAGGNEIDFSQANNPARISIDAATGLLDLTIYFSLIFDFNEMKNAPWRITLAPLFPRSLSPVALQYVNWASGDRLLLRWEGLKTGDEYPHYYRLTIPGGAGGISSSPGINMKENITILLEAVK